MRGVSRNRLSSACEGSKSQLFVLGACASVPLPHLSEQREVGQSAHSRGQERSASAEPRAVEQRLGQCAEAEGRVSSAVEVGLEGEPGARGRGYDRFRRFGGVGILTRTHTPLPSMHTKFDHLPESDVCVCCSFCVPSPPKKRSMVRTRRGTLQHTHGCITIYWQVC